MRNLTVSTTPHPLHHCLQRATCKPAPVNLWSSRVQKDLSQSALLCLALPCSALPALDSSFLWVTQLFKPKTGMGPSDGDKKRHQNELMDELGLSIEEVDILGLQSPSFIC